MRSTDSTTRPRNGGTQPRCRTTTLHIRLAVALAAVLAASGCGSNGGPGPSPEPDGVSVVTESRSVQVAESLQVEARYTYPQRADGPECDWYVDGVLGGTETSGTITQTNPAVYTAPDAVPQGGLVELEAVTRSDPGLSGADTLRVLFSVLHVDAATGIDAPGRGAWNAPLRTISYALKTSVSGDTVLVSAGDYDQGHGEAGSFEIPARVTLKGAGPDSCSIAGSGSAFYVIGLGDGAVFESFTLLNGGSDQIGVLSEGGGAVRDISVGQPFDYSVVRADGSVHGPGNDVLIEGCVIDNALAPRTETALELYDGTHCSLRNCEVTGWLFGISIDGDARPLIEDCIVSDNYYGIVLTSGGEGQVADADLGGGSRGSLGGNAISANLAVGVSNYTAADVWALWNTWSSDPPTEGPPFPSDFYNSAGGTVIWSR